MNTDALYLLFRQDVVDTKKPYLWSDDEVFAYMNDAYTMFVRLTGGVPDFTSVATKIHVYSGDPLVDLHPALMRIRTATLASDGTEVNVINAQDMQSLNDEDYGVLRRINVSTGTGRVRYLVTGMERGKGRVINIPTADDEIDLVIERLPLEPLSDFGQELTDIEPHHHIHLLKWMEYMAYSKPDLETFNKARSDQKKADFEEYCQLAKREKEQYKHKVRTVRYGGI